MTTRLNQLAISPSCYLSNQSNFSLQDKPSTPHFGKFHQIDHRNEALIKQNLVKKTSNATQLRSKRRSVDFEGENNPLSVRLDISKYMNKQSVQKKDSYRKEPEKQAGDKHTLNRSNYDNQRSWNDRRLNTSDINRSVNRSLNKSISQEMQKLLSSRSQSPMSSIFESQSSFLRAETSPMARRDSDNSYLDEDIQYRVRESILNKAARKNRSKSYSSKGLGDLMNRQAPPIDQQKEKSSMGERRGSVPTLVSEENIISNRLMNCSQYTANPTNPKRVHTLGDRGSDRKERTNKPLNSHRESMIKKERENVEGWYSRLINTSMKQLQAKRTNNNDRRGKTQRSIL